MSDKVRRAQLMNWRGGMLTGYSGSIKSASRWYSSSEFTVLQRHDTCKDSTMRALARDIEKAMYKAEEAMHTARRSHDLLHRYMIEGE